MGVALGMLRRLDTAGFREAEDSEWASSLGVGFSGIVGRGLDFF